MMTENEYRNSLSDHEDYMRMEDVASEPCQGCIDKQDTIDRLSAELDAANRESEDLNSQLNYERQSHATH